MPSFVFYMFFLATFVSATWLEGRENSTTAVNSFIQDFAKGHESFKTVYFKDHEQDFMRLVKEGQSPKVLFIGCSDSRVVPDLILSTNPGDLFVIRTAGNFVPTYNPSIPWDGVAATIQYAVEVLGVSEIIVCGHSHCGAIKGLFESKKDAKLLEILTSWLGFGEQAKKLTLLSLKSKSTTPKERDDLAGHLSVIYQLEHLLSFPFVKQKVESQKIFLHGWYFTIESGEMEYFDSKTYQFFPLSQFSSNPKGQGT